MTRVYDTDCKSRGKTADQVRQYHKIASIPVYFVTRKTTRIKILLWPTFTPSIAHFQCFGFATIENHFRARLPENNQPCTCAHVGISVNVSGEFLFSVRVFCVRKHREKAAVYRLSVFARRG